METMYWDAWFNQAIIHSLDQATNQKANHGFAHCSPCAYLAEGL
jgi:HD superfamily phosphodiesterase